jgi:predicted RNA-binding Zn-ribbon protein involved in translation (DUF1610 family)
VHGSDYSYGIQLSYHLRKAGVALREVPIHFADPARRASKIPRLQVLLSAWDLFVLAAKRFNRYRELGPDQFVSDACPGCGDQVLALKHFANRPSNEARREELSAAAYRCTSVAQRSYPPVYICLNCGLQQVPASAIPRDLEGLYKDVVDEQYLRNIEARDRTFHRLFDQISSSLPTAPGHMLEVGAYCGLFAREATRRGWDVDGVEPSAWAAKYARETIGVNVYTGLLAENGAKLHDEYDVVASWDVLEHVRDPLQFVRVLDRFDYIRRDIEARVSQQKVEALLSVSRKEAEKRLRMLDEEARRLLGELDRYAEFIGRANEPTLLPTSGKATIAGHALSATAVNS